jgi:hypothetical protein
LAAAGTLRLEPRSLVLGRSHGRRFVLPRRRSPWSTISTSPLPGKGTAAIASTAFRTPNAEGSWPLQKKIVAHWCLDAFLLNNLTIYLCKNLDQLNEYISWTKIISCTWTWPVVLWKVKVWTGLLTRCCLHSNRYPKHIITIKDFLQQEGGNSEYSRSGHVFMLDTYLWNYNDRLIHVNIFLSIATHGHLTS